MQSKGYLIREARQSIKLSQAKLSKSIGITQAVLSQWELGKKEPSQEEFALVMKTITDIENQVLKGEVRLNEKKFLHKMGTTKNKSPFKSPLEYQDELKSMKYNYSHKDNKNYLEELDKLGMVLKTNKEEDTNNSLTGIALFSGCGGFSLGFKAAGVKVLGHVEINEYARKVYQANFPDSLCLGTDITEIEENDIHEWKNKFGHINFLFGGPPCQGFSLAGKRNPEDERNILFKEYMKIAKIVQPDVLVFENVRVMTSLKDANGKLFVNQLMEDLKAIGFNAKFTVLNAQDYGVPQSRERIILIAVNENLGINDFEMPKQTHTKNVDMDIFSLDLKKYVTFKDAVGDLKELEMGQIDENDPLHWTISHPEHVVNWLKATPEGKSAHENEDPELRPPSGYNTTYKRIHWDEPCSTISTNFNMISGSRNVHPKNTRSFSIREATRCQTFPDNFVFFGPWGEVRKMIGNAVPPLLSYKIAEHLKNEILLMKKKVEN